MTLPITISSRLDRTHPAGCWMWKGGLCDKGYGIVNHGGRTRRVHRLVYELEVGPIPADKPMLRHQCEEHHRGIEGRRCCNPEHLIPGTALENAEDRSRKGRSARQPRPMEHIDRRMR